MPRDQKQKGHGVFSQICFWSWNAPRKLGVPHDCFSAVSSRTRSAHTVSHYITGYPRETQQFRGTSRGTQQCPTTFAQRFRNPAQAPLSRGGWPPVKNDWVTGGRAGNQTPGLVAATFFIYLYLYMYIFIILSMGGTIFRLQLLLQLHFFGPVGRS